MPATIKRLAQNSNVYGAYGIMSSDNWHWKSRHVGGRPRIDSEIRALIRRMSRDNPLWGASRIHRELLMLGIEVAESTVSRYMVRRRRPPSQGWKTFLRNHVGGVASLDLFVVGLSRSSCSTAW